MQDDQIIEKEKLNLKNQLFNALNEKEKAQRVIKEQNKVIVQCRNMLYALDFTKRQNENNAD